MENTNKYNGLNMEEYNKFLKMIKAGSPVHKINFTLDNPNAIVGMYLITMENMESYLDKAADKTDIDDNTLLVFESRHVIECCQIIYGCLYILGNMDLFYTSFDRVFKYITDNIIKTTLVSPSFYKYFISDMDSIAGSYFKSQSQIGNNTEIYKKFKYIMKNIWFVPYGKIDEMAEEAIKEFEENSKKDGDASE